MKGLNANPQRKLFFRQVRRKKVKVTKLCHEHDAALLKDLHSEAHVGASQTSMMGFFKEIS